MKLQEFYKSNYRLLCLFCNSYLNDIEVSKDVAQESFIKLYLSSSKFSDVKAMRAYLYKTAKNLCLNIYRHNEKIEKFKFISETDKDVFFENAIIEAETTIQIHSAIEKLSEQKQIVIKQYLKGMSYEDISVSLNLSKNTVKTHLRESFRELRGQLKNKNLFGVLIFLKKS